MCTKIEEVLWKIEICEKFDITTDPPKSFISVTVTTLFSTWAIYVVEPILTPMKNSHSKNYIITSASYASSRQKSRR